MTRKYDISHWGTPEQRFWKYANRNEGCWVWSGRRGNSGYGLLKVDKKQVSAHRYSYQLHFKEIPPRDLYVCHTCDNKLCVNPQHLWLGTPKQNQADMYKKGRDRHISLKGESNPRSKLTQVDVDKIREVYRNGGHSQRALAKQYGVTKTNILNILKKRIWK